MPHVVGIRTILFASALALVACGKDQIQGPQAEVKKTDIKVDLPATPDFALPPSPSDGSHTVKELRVKGKKLFDTDITVHGFVTWAYDCATAIRKPDEKDADVQKRIDDDPTICERPKFFVGDAKDTPPEKSLWVVDVPRPYNKQELKNVQKKDRNPVIDNKCEPTEMKDPKKNICPPYAVGDEVTVTGAFKMASQHGDSNSEGLVVYKKMTNISQGNWTSPDIAPPPPPAGGAPAPGPASGGPAKQSPEALVNGTKKKG